MLGTILLLWESLELGNNRILYVLSLLFSFLSLFWHESGVMTLFYLCVVILLFRNDAFKKKVFYLFPFFLIAFVYVVFRFFFLSINVIILKPMALFHMSVWQYWATLFQLLTWYITRLFYPQGIVMAWMSPVVHQFIFLNVFGAVLLLMTFLLLCIMFTKNKICLLAISWILIGIAPVCFAAFRMSDSGPLIEPHWFIFASIGFFILAAYFCLTILNRMKRIGLFLLFFLIFIWVAVSHANNLLWADQKTYASYWIQQVPNLRNTYLYLADAYYMEGAFKEARKYYRMALSGVHSDSTIYNNIGAANQADGNLKEAELNYKMSLKINPYSSVDYNDLGGLYLQEGQFDKARHNFDHSLSLNPLLMEPRRGLASIFLERSEYKKAIELCFKNLDIVNDDSKTLLLLIDIFIQEKDFVNLKKYAYRIINSESDPKLLRNLGATLAQNNIPAIALDSFEKAIRLSPNDKDTYRMAGTFFANLGKYDEAIYLWRIGLSIDPNDQRFRMNIAKAEKLK